MSDKSSTTSGGIGFTSLLTIAFIVLKLCNVIDWSWWWVLSPAWIPASLLLIGLGIYMIYCYFQGKALDKKMVNKRGELKSKWQLRMEQMQEAREKAEELKAQRNA